MVAVRLREELPIGIRDRSTANYSTCSWRLVPGPEFLDFPPPVAVKTPIPSISIITKQTCESPSFETPIHTAKFSDITS